MVDVKNLIAAISPDIYCENVPDAMGKVLSEEVKKIIKKEGFTKAAEIAKLRESIYLDVIFSSFEKSPFDLIGLKNPIEKHTLTYDASAQSLEEVYFWILDFINSESKLNQFNAIT